MKTPSPIDDRHAAFVAEHPELIEEERELKKARRKLVSTSTLTFKEGVDMAEARALAARIEAFNAARAKACPEMYLPMGFPLLDAEPELAALEGTDKQIAWAEKIRADFIARGRDVPAYRAWLKTQTSAELFIKHRYEGGLWADYEKSVYLEK